MAGIGQAMPAMHTVRRVITRAPDLGAEDYQAVSVATFEKMASDGAFALHWGAHGLFYGVPANETHHLAEGTDCLVNFSRKALAEGAAIFPQFIVLNITASPETLAHRLAARGRETAADIARRLAEAQKPLPEGLTILTVSNDGPLEQAIVRATALLQPESA